MFARAGNYNIGRAELSEYVGRQKHEHATLCISFSYRHWIADVAFLDYYENILRVPILLSVGYAGPWKTQRLHNNRSDQR